MRVGATRVTLDTVVAAFQIGLSAEAIAERYPTLALGDVYAVIAFYLRHGAEVQAYLAYRQQNASRVRAANQSKHPPVGVKERLLSRQ
ncbi:hypothetical protein Pla175_03550 [Pirellulimonas nuda]|uniref:DUF433 domain-containing protein n=1 Tax=Pirellulimonas nuda TaxID=2528009 RepID=A0A518D6B1_9BACT|nr:DUF433 domain-containing protein [Pirellulimonas nuda]QDU87001.1 hypothetical protein Pla175_03550 [Pirellulimonas nuda]